MAQTRKNASGRRSSSSSKRKNNRKTDDSISENLINEVILILVITLALALVLCNFGILGAVGNAVSNVLFGIFGMSAYVVSVVAAYIVFFSLANHQNSKAIRRSVSLGLLLLIFSMFCGLVSFPPETEIPINTSEIWEFSFNNHKGAGILGGILNYYSVKGLSKIGTVFLLIVITIILLVIITEKSFIKGVRNVSDTSKRALEMGAENFYVKNAERATKRSEKRYDMKKLREEKQNEKRLKQEVLENEKVLKRKEVSGVPTYNFVSEEEISKNRDDIHEINLINQAEEFINRETDIRIHGIDLKDEIIEPEPEVLLIPDDDAPKPVKINESIFKENNTLPTNGGRTFGTESGTAKEAYTKSVSANKIKKSSKPYKTPDINLLSKGANSKAKDKNELMQTARKLEEVLASFNVNAKVTDVSQGPSVTRYEMIPETGVKVSKILSLSDDLKLNLAAADIRIEAPIPGKAAIGIEVPNKESSSVALRDLLESKEFKSSESKISFAVGKDLAGKVVVTDIAKMPHMLIAGATGSGKSVCINTLIMSILYKARPDEVKLIMIDPKVVELSVYNGIPHLLIPVVTDPKKANASLQWAVKEMDDRYQKFAEWGVRDLKGYNEKISNEKDENGNPLSRMFQLVVIVDELADLMMVAGKEVEESICRLAQLARAAGIHLIIATQRPSVDVITGLIKANMPSRIAFSVSSGVDSRTILDMVGAEKLLGKGDMLFYPQGYSKPARVQGAFVSDREVSNVVEFLKNNSGEINPEENEIESKISSLSDRDSESGSVQGGRDDGMDEYFCEAGRLITQTQKCSIGMLQRKFKIGFNRAARIMDALSEAGVVGPEEGTKPRSILMTSEEFENYINE